MVEDKLFTPFVIGDVMLKNRLGVAPMTRMSSKTDSIPRKDVLDFLVRRAEKGASIVYTEAIVTDYESAQGYPGQARLLTQRQIEAWKPVVSAIAEKGALAVAQVFHCGRMAWPEINTAGRIVAPSPVTPDQDNPLTGEPYPKPDEMSHFDIEHVIDGFVETAKGVAEAGFKALEIHGAHGYLISQFLSSYSNKRSDEFGGSIERRFRFMKEIITRVKSVLPKDMLLFARISNWGVADMGVSLFKCAQEWQDLVRMLAELPIDAISVSTYEYHAKAFESDKPMAALTREATDLPIFICGKIYDRKSAEDALRYADIALSGKSILLNPNWVEDVREGKELELYSSEAANIAYTEEPLP